MNSFFKGVSDKNGKHKQKCYKSCKINVLVEYLFVFIRNMFPLPNLLRKSLCVATVGF